MTQKRLLFYMTARKAATIALDPPFAEQDQDKDSNADSCEFEMNSLKDALFKAMEARERL